MTSTPIKTITNMETNKYPSDLFDLFIDMWKIQEADLGGLEMSLVRTSNDEGKITLGLKRHGQPIDYFAKALMDLNNLRKMLEFSRTTDKCFNLLHADCDRIEKASWIGINGVNPFDVPYFMVVFHLHSLNAIIEEIHHRNIPIYLGDAFMSYFSIQPGNGHLFTGQLVTINPIGLVETAKASDPTNPPMGIVCETIKEGELINISIQANPSSELMEFRRAEAQRKYGPSPIFDCNWRNNVIKEEPPTPQPRKKPKGVVIHSIDSIREKLRRE